MIDIPAWVIGIITVLGSAISVFVSVRLSIATLSEKVRSNTEEIDRIRKWKHEIGEAYLPRAVDEHERRLNRLDVKVFNGPR
jgi:hypothetical protein